MTRPACFTLGLVLSLPVFSGCGGSSANTTTAEAKVQPLTDAAKAEFKSQVEQANGEEQAQRGRETVRPK